VFALRVTYHAEASSDAQRMLVDVANNLLSPDGVCILYHIANTPKTFQDFRARFGSKAGGTADSNTGAVTIDDPPAQIRTVCSTNGLPLWEIEFLTKLRFGLLRDEEWRAFKDPQSYDALADANSGAYEDLKRLYFVVQRSPLEFAMDRSATGLQTFIDEIREVIEANQGVLTSAEQMQVFTKPHAAPSLREAIPDALTASISAGAQR
jgi:hypothetical protein